MTDSAPDILNVLVITPLGRGGQGGIDRLMDEVRIALEDKPELNVRPRFSASRGSGSLVWAPFYLTKSIVALVGSRATKSVDLVHLNLAHNGSAIRKMIIAAIARRLGVPYVVHLHGSEFRQFWDSAPVWLDRPLKRFFLNAAQVIVLGKIWAEFVLQKVPDVAKHIAVVPNASRAAPEMGAALKGDNGTLQILFLGKLGARKGTPDLISALAHLPRLPAWRAVLAGNGDVEVSRERVKKLELDDRVSIPGWMNDLEVSDLLACSDILVLPSFNENLPMSVIEGCAYGLAIVATPVGATEEVIKPGFSGLLVTPGDVSELTKAISRLLSDTELRMTLGRNARELHTKTFEIGAYTKRLTEIWWIASGKERPPHISPFVKSPPESAAR